MPIKTADRGCPLQVSCFQQEQHASRSLQAASDEYTHDLSGRRSGDAFATTQRSTHTVVKKQKRMGAFYEHVDDDDKLRSIRHLFNDHKKEMVRKRKKREKEQEAAHQQFKLSDSDQTFGFITQNVNGFGSTEADRSVWFQSFGKRDSHGRPDITRIQETHVEPEEVDKFRQHFAGRWGFRCGADQPEHSFWAASENRKGGVAILIDPYGAFKHATPWHKERWSPHFVAARGTLDGQSVTVCNIYAPHQDAARERFYNSLQDIEFVKEDLLLIGGDFNCTLDEEADRSYHGNPQGHDSPALRGLLTIWGVLDPIALARPQRWEREELTRHHYETHTPINTR